MYASVCLAKNSTAYVVLAFPSAGGVQDFMAAAATSTFTASFAELIRSASGGDVDCNCVEAKQMRCGWNNVEDEHVRALCSVLRAACCAVLCCAVLRCAALRCVALLSVLGFLLLLLCCCVVLRLVVLCYARPCHPVSCVRCVGCVRRVQFADKRLIVELHPNNTVAAWRERHHNGVPDPFGVELAATMDRAVNAGVSERDIRQLFPTLHVDGVAIALRKDGVLSATVTFRNHDDMCAALTLGGARLLHNHGVVTIRRATNAKTATAPAVTGTLGDQQRRGQRQVGGVLLRPSLLVSLMHLAACV
jgi:hypothetical protein